MTSPSWQQSSDSRYFVLTLDAKNVVDSINEDWLTFAAENDASALTQEAVVGKKILDFISGKDAKHLYETMFAHIRESGKPLNFSFRCDTPSRLRLVEVTISLLPSSRVEVRSRILKEASRKPVALLDVRAQRSDEFLIMCSWCKKIELSDGKGWVEVDEAVNRLSLFHEPVLPQLSHGICPECMKELESKLSLF